MQREGGQTGGAERTPPHTQDHPAGRTSALDIEGDSWIALDKVQHFAVCALLVIAGHLGAINSSKYYRYRIILAVAPAAIVAAGKELGDYLQVATVHDHKSPPFLESAIEIHF